MLTLHLTILLLLILLNGFFAMAEIALVSARPARLQPRAAEGSAGAQAALELKADPSRLLATVQIGITIIAVLTGTFGEATQSSERDVPDYVEIDHQRMQGRFIRAPKPTDVPYPVTMEPNLVIEYYSR